MARLAPMPSFVIIGFRRNATRWLRHNLDRHPEICAPPLYSSFFTDEHLMVRRGLRWYREQYEDWDGEEIVGDCSWRYADWSHDPFGTSTRMRKVLGRPRIIVMLDDPVRRFQSALRHRIRWGEIPADVDVDDLYAMRCHQDVLLATIVEGMMTPSLQPYLGHFGDAVLPVLVDDVRADPAAVYRRVLEHIGADPDVVPDGLDRVRYSDRGIVRLPELPLRERQLVFAWSRTDVERLSALIERDLSSWDPGIGEGVPTTEELFAGMMAGKGPDQSTSAEGAA